MKKIRSKRPRYMFMPTPHPIPLARALQQMKETIQRMRSYPGTRHDVHGRITHHVWGSATRECWVAILRKRVGM